MDNIKFRPVDTLNWQHLEFLFESKGGPHNCWCMVWRNMEDGKSRLNKNDKKSSLKKYIEKQIPVGILCYENDVPIAWCSIAPRNSYRDLQGVSDLNNVWSLVCFYIKKEHRQKGIAEKLIKESIKYAKENGAKYVEAYPVDEDSPSYRFMGFKTTFDKMGFDFKYKIGKRRNVMIITILS